MKEFKNITEFTRELRKQATPAEDKLWQSLRGRKMDGLKFLRQYPIAQTTFKNRVYYFVADFYCDAKKLVVEVDGSIHQYQQEYDEQRDIVLKEKGIHTFRVSNEEVMENVFKVMDGIREEIKKNDLPLK